MQFLIAIAILVGGYWLIKKSARMQPAQARGFATRIAGGGIVALSGLLAMRGSTQIAVPMFIFGLGLLGVSGFQQHGGFKWGKERSTGQRSTVATDLLSMELEHDSGDMTGTILKGAYAGRKLSELSDTELRAFYTQCQKSDRQGLKLLEAWLNRNHKDWVERWSAKQASGSSMSRDEAYSVLGLKPGASEDEVRRAHRNLMKDYHPDRGGSDYLAAKINAAKDLLLGE